MNSKNDRYDSQNLANTEIHLKDLILKLKKWLKFFQSKTILIFILGVTGAIIGYGYAAMIKPVYTAVCTFVLDDGSDSGIAQSSLAAVVGLDGGESGGLFKGDNITQLYTSRTMIRQTLLSNITYDGKRELLLDYYINFTGLKKKLNNDPQLKGISFTPGSGQVFNRAQDSIINLIADNIIKNNLIVSKPDRKLSMFNVEVKSEDEFFSKTFNDIIVKNVNDFYIKTKTAKSLFNISVLQHQTDSVRAVVNRALTSSTTIMDATPNLNPTRQALRAPVQRLQFNNEGNRALLSQLTVNLELAKVNLRKETPLIEVVDIPIFPLQKLVVSKIKSALIGFISLSFLCCFFIFIQKLLLDTFKEK